MAWGAGNSGGSASRSREGLRGPDCYEPSAPSSAVLIYLLMRVADVYSRAFTLHPSHGEAGNCRELLQYTGDVVDPKAKSAGAMHWAHVIFFAIAFNSPSFSFIIRSISAAEFPWVVCTFPASSPLSKADTSSVNLTGQFTY